jgi:hypothetical protein
MLASKWPGSGSGLLLAEEDGDSLEYMADRKWQHLRGFSDLEAV